MKTYKKEGRWDLVFARWGVQVFHPSIFYNRARGFQLLADTAIRLDPSHRAFAVLILGFGLAIIPVPQ